ncbi:DrmB family protein [uncultured Sphingomonas sp.]|uniref:DrmB family protein n=1 Tax=uncultured Sphingomonas sp. TaxID=158754 RepID=UPI0035CC5394
MERPDFRSSQGVVPFGVGAIIDFANESLMTAGLDAWPFEQVDPAARTEILKATQVLDGRLARRLTADLGRPIDFFLSPTEAPEFGVGHPPRFDRAPMPFVRFPNWYFCPRCRIMKEMPWNTQSRSEALRCDNPGRRVEGKADPCSKLPPKRRPRLSPVRFVVACEAGHIMDFPWFDWAHSAGSTTCSETGSELYLYSTTAAGLAGVMVKCVTCGANRSMAGAFQRDALSAIYAGQCPGERPWLGPDGKQPCTANVLPQTIQRGASNAYFAKLTSSILIPPYSARVQQVLDRPDVWSEIESVPKVDGAPHEPFLRQKARNLGLDEDAFVKTVADRLRAIDAPADDAAAGPVGEARYRFDEYQAYVGPRPPAQERTDFDTRAVAAGEYADWFARLFDAVVLVRRLRETRVLTGFTRIVPSEAAQGKVAELALARKRWLPGFSVRGEGVFLRFSATALESWNLAAQPAERLRTMQAQLDRVSADRGRPRRTITPTEVLIHTFAHLLIRQMAFECGYDTSSIRERLYVSDAPDTPMAGLLLYTASGDAEGTLGGLVRQGEPGRLDATVAAAMANAGICSSDPLCIESEGQGTYGLNRAACHACALLPETSCEEGNLLLDRALAIGTPADPTLGYFKEAIGTWDVPRDGP